VSGARHPGEKLFAIGRRADFLGQRAIKIVQRTALGRGAPHQNLSDWPNVGGEVFTDTLEFGLAVEGRVLRLWDGSERGGHALHRHGRGVIQPIGLQLNQFHRR
jgi:hypothetical protein